MSSTPRSRWPGWVYGVGEEPDPRFSLANERTFLAWIRTSLAFVAGGVAVDAVDLGLDDGVRTPLAILLVVLGIVCAVASWARWARTERALRRSAPLPGSPLGVVVALGLVVASLVVLASL
ncbi:MAG TPA: DUF202 domain-containing protein [Nocardioides sp.]